MEIPRPKKTHTNCLLNFNYSFFDPLLLLSYRVLFFKILALFSLIIHDDGYFSSLDLCMVLAPIFHLSDPHGNPSGRGVCNLGTHCGTHFHPGLTPIKLISKDLGRIFHSVHKMNANGLFLDGLSMDFSQ